MPCSFCKGVGHNIRSCNQKSKKNECSICYCEIGKKNNAITPCGHHFCFNCISNCLNEKSNCPMCRELIAPVKDKIFNQKEFNEEMDNYYHSGFQEGYDKGLDVYNIFNIYIYIIYIYNILNIYNI